MRTQTYCQRRHTVAGLHCHELLQDPLRVLTALPRRNLLTCSLVAPPSLSVTFHVAPRLAKRRSVHGARADKVWLILGEHTLAIFWVKNSGARFASLDLFAVKPLRLKNVTPHSIRWQVCAMLSSFGHR